MFSIPHRAQVLKIDIDGFQVMLKKFKIKSMMVMIRKTFFKNFRKQHTKFAILKKEHFL